MIARSSGLLLHVSSLPGGRLGKEAFRFVDFCADAGQRWWQVLPVTPTDHSPYSALSAFAGNERLLDRSDDGEARNFAPAWLKPYVCFRALRDKRSSTPERHERDQRRFQHQWMALKRYARRQGVRLIGDLPLFVARDSADVWAHPELFKLDRRGRPTVVTGVPPDYFSESGQIWHDPHYRWDVHRKRRFRWWIARLARMFELFDAVRIDHFLGLLRAWEVPARARTARRGRWAKGPGAALLRAVRAALGNRTLIAEDLGLVTPEADALRRSFSMPGMRVLHFSFGEDPAARPDRFPKDCVVYTGTHDNDTTVGWFRKAGADGERARRYARCRRDRIHWGLIRVAMECPARLSIVPVQDLLGLGSRARMNRPGTVRGNWRWRLKRGQLTPRLARRLRRLTGEHGR